MTKTEVRDRLVLDNIGVVKAIARRVHRGLPAHVEVDDLISVGIVGLIEAADKFDPAKNVSFPAFARFRIRGEILDSLRRLDWMSRDLRALSKRLQAAKEDLVRTLGRFPTQTEIAEKLGIDLVAFHKLHSELRAAAAPLSLSNRNRDEDDLPPPDVACPAELQPDRVCMDVERKAALSTALRTLPERYQKIMTLYYIEGVPMEEIARRLGVTAGRISQMHKVAIEKLRASMEDVRPLKSFAVGA